MAVRYLFPPETVFPISGMCPSKQEYAAFKTFLERELGGFEADVAINNYGEAVQNYPGEIASMIAGGTVWVDYCGWPMYYLLTGWPYPSEGETGYEINPSRFGDFLRAAGKPLTFTERIGVQRQSPVFDPHNDLAYSFFFTYAEYPWARGLTTDVDILTRGFVAPPSGPDFPSASKVGVDPVTGQSVRIYCQSCFGLKYGAGWYFYAWRGNPGILKPIEGVLPANYAKFVAQTLKTAQPPQPPPPPPPQPPTGCNPPYPTLSYGSTGPCVALLQYRLALHGFNPGPQDGIFGPRTLQAVRDFQVAKGLVVDGIVGPQTWGALMQEPSVPGRPPEEVILPIEGKEWQPILVYALLGGGLLAVAVGGYIAARAGD